MSITWKSEKRKVSDLCPADYNPRQLSKKQVKDLSVSLNKFNLASPVVINQNNKIIGGHQRISLLVEKNIDEVDVRVPDRLLTDSEEKELNLRLNKNLGEWDFDKLVNFDDDLLKDVGFSDKEIAKGENGFGVEDEAEVEFTTELLECQNYIVLAFDNVMDWNVALDKFGIKQKKSLYQIEVGAERMGTGRVINGAQALGI